MNKKVISVLLVVFGILYFVSPIDAAPGPIDDVVIAIVSLIGTIKLNQKQKAQIEQSQEVDA